jgi:hypothetical protein
VFFLGNPKNQPIFLPAFSAASACSLEHLFSLARPTPGCVYVHPFVPVPHCLDFWGIPWAVLGLGPFPRPRPVLPSVSFFTGAPYPPASPKTGTVILSGVFMASENKAVCFQDAHTTVRKGAFKSHDELIIGL